MKRHENLYSAIVAFAAAVAFLLLGIGVKVLLKPYENDAAASYLFFMMIPMAIFAFAAVLLILGGYSLLNDRAIENGKTVEAEVTGINEFFVGKGTADVHYNLFCEAHINGRKYRFSCKNITEEQKNKITDKHVSVRYNPKDPRQYFVEI